MKFAKEKGYRAIISADTMNVSSIIPMQLEATGEIDVILGVRLSIVDCPLLESENKKLKELNEPLLEFKRDVGYSFTALVKNDKGFSDICELCSLGYERAQFYKYPRLDLQQVIDIYARGNIVLITSDYDSVFRRRDYNVIMTKLADINKDDLYSAVYPMASPFFDQINIKACQVAESLF